MLIHTNILLNKEKRCFDVRTNLFYWFEDWFCREQSLQDDELQSIYKLKNQVNTRNVATFRSVQKWIFTELTFHEFFVVFRSLFEHSSNEVKFLENKLFAQFSLVKKQQKREYGCKDCIIYFQKAYTVLISNLLYARKVQSFSCQSCSRS